MALDLHIHPCIHCPPHPLHPPSIEKPLRIQIQGPLESIQKLLPDVTWYTDPLDLSFPQLAGPRLATLTFQQLYRQEVRQGIDGELVVRDEYLGWVTEGQRPLNRIDYYGVTFDHLVPIDDSDPEVLPINIIEVDNDEGSFANEHLLFAINPADYTGRRVLAVPRCCQKKKGTQDRGRINRGVAEKDREIHSAAGTLSAAPDSSL